MESTKFKLFTPSQKFKPDRISLKKVAIIGSGKVASSIAFSLVLKEVCDHVVIVDKNEERLKAEAQDYQYGSYFLTSRPKIQATTDFSSAKGAKIVILAIDVTKIEGEDFTEVLQRNVDVYKATVPNAIQFCSDAIFIVVSATCDILSCEFIIIFDHSATDLLNICTQTSHGSCQDFRNLASLASEQASKRHDFVA